MTAVSWHGVMSLDGFITAPGDDMRWIFELAGPSDGVDDGLRCCFHCRHLQRRDWKRHRPDYRAGNPLESTS
jgi:hypothetical protein